MPLACLAIGMALRRFKLAPENAHTALNAFIIIISLPALALLQIQAGTLEPSLICAVLMPRIVFAASVGLFAPLGRALRLPRTTTGALAVVGGLGNTSFAGLSLIGSLSGAGGMPVGTPSPRARSPGASPPSRRPSPS
jgi:predicted permease